MAKTVLIHWNPDEGALCVKALERAGVEAVLCTPRGGAGLREFAAAPPDAFVIDLSRLPSHGRAVAQFLRQQKATRFVPLVFAGGAPEKIARTRDLLPDAQFTDWPRIRQTLRTALKQASASPVVPGTMAAYSGTPLTKKLGIKPGETVALIGASPQFARKLEPLP